MKSVPSDDNQDSSQVFPAPEAGRPAEDSIEVTPPQETKRRVSFWRRSLRWLLGILVVFSLGALFVAWLFYIPLQEQMSRREAELQAANQRVSELEARVNNLSTLETENQAQQGQLRRTNLHITLLSARADVLSAQLSLAKNDPTRARVALNKTPQTLENLADLLEPNQQKIAGDMQARLELALKEMDGNTYAAQSDLDVLATSLLEIENAFFARP